MPAAVGGCSQPFQLVALSSRQGKSSLAAPKPPLTNGCQRSPPSHSVSRQSATERLPLAAFRHGNPAGPGTSVAASGDNHHTTRHCNNPTAHPSASMTMLMVLEAGERLPPPWTPTTDTSYCVGRGAVVGARKLLSGGRARACARACTRFLLTTGLRCCSRAPRPSWQTAAGHSTAVLSRAAPPACPPRPPTACSAHSPLTRHRRTCSADCSPRNSAAAVVVVTVTSAPPLRGRAVKVYCRREAAHGTATFSGEERASSGTRSSRQDSTAGHRERCPPWRLSLRREAPRSPWLWLRQWPQRRAAPARQVVAW